LIRVLSASDGTDYVCKSCSKLLYQRCRQVDEAPNIRHIWRKRSEKIFKMANQVQSIEFWRACIPELVNGLRLCAKYDVSAIGVPLDANRCVRWMGDFYPNSVNEKKILSILT
jgi:hypothetical protein